MSPKCLFDFVIQVLPVKEDITGRKLIRTIEPDSRLLSFNFGNTANGFSLRIVIQMTHSDLQRLAAPDYDSGNDNTGLR